MIASKSLLLLAALPFGFACSSYSEVQASEGETSSPDPACSIPLGWWESKNLEPLFTGASGPVPTMDCQFHLWAWTAFVHFTMLDSSGQPLFMSLPTPDQLSSGAPSAPDRLKLGPRDLKRSQLGEINQADSQGVIVDQNGRAVYYSTHLDHGYFDFARQYFGIDEFNSAPPTAVFPIGATSIKASWRVVQPGEDVSGFFTTLADIAKLENVPGSSGNVSSIAPSGDYLTDVRVALVGMHVVSVLADHPEFAWATFELEGNAPNLPVGMAPDSKDAVSDAGFTFYKAGTPAKDCNVNKEGQGATVNVSTQVCQPVVQIFREFEYGDAAPARVADIEQVNAEFKKALPNEASNNPSLNPVFAAYTLTGTVWQDAGTLKPGESDMQGSAVGSTSLMNSTMETFVQGKGQSCFSCHNTAAGTGPEGSFQAANIGLSHVLLGPFFGD